MNITCWSDRPLRNILTENQEAYDKIDEDQSRVRVDLNEYPTYDVFGDEIPVYTKKGYKICRRRAEEAQPCGNLMDLTIVHTLFETEVDQYGNA